MENVRPLVEVGGESFERIPIATHVLGPTDNIIDIARDYLSARVLPGDWIIMSEKAVAASQGRAVPVECISPSLCARLLSRCVRKVPYGIGLGIPETMEMAIHEVGLPRILIAAAAAAVTRLVGWRGVFYHIAGRRAAAIDGPTPYTLPPYNTCVVLAPSDPARVCHEVQAVVGCETAIVDVNDLGSEVLGATAGIDRRRLCEILRDNPLGQSCEQTPLGIVRRRLPEPAGIEQRFPCVKPADWPSTG